jgi:hypothetical protein
MSKMAISKNMQQEVPPHWGQTIPQESMEQAPQLQLKMKAWISISRHQLNFRAATMQKWHS